MEIIYKTGDLLQATEKYIIHGCNAKGGFGSGVAGLIREKFPEAYTVYNTAHRVHDLGLGKIFWADCGTVIIGNCITQQDYGRDPLKVYVSYAAIQTVMGRINDMLTDSDDRGLRIAMPLIGAGLANGSWSLISKIIEETSENFQPIVYLIDGIVPTT
jgi:O-acetyl-ADP-ribose deacetylase (regulator of RNase III)